jgi:hypothetical protein
MVADHLWAPPLLARHPKSEVKPPQLAALLLERSHDTVAVFDVLLMQALEDNKQ